MLSSLKTGSISSVVASPIPNLNNCSKEDIKAYFLNAYDIDESLFSCVKDAQSFYTNPDPLRLVLIFYLVHPASLFINKLLLCRAINKRINELYEAMFETGVDEMSWDDVVSLSRIEGGEFNWPTVEKGMEYRRTVRKLVLKLIDDTPLELPITEESQGGLWWAILLGVEHERIHIETSSCLLRQLPIEKVQFPSDGLWKYAPEKPSVDPGDNTFIKVNGKQVKFGKPKDFPTYGWCHEYGQCDQFVPDFEAQKYPVRNREFLQFVQDGGYDNESLWTVDGWSWRQYACRTHPLWWVPTEDPDQPFRYRAIFSIIDLPLDWPVDVNYHEAKAYANWLGSDYRLPTEAEYWLMRKIDQSENQVSVNDEFQMKTSPSDLQANILGKFASSSPVNMFPPNQLGFYDLFGNVWEWCEDHFNGYPGYKTYTLYDDFSTPCFDGRHNTITGGSWISGGSEASIFARFGFRRHFMQHAGFRLVRSNLPTPVRLISTSVFILGAGEDKNPCTVPRISKANYYPSANLQFHTDSSSFVYNDLLLSYGSHDQIDPNNILSPSVPHNQFDQFFDKLMEYLSKYSSNRTQMKSIVDIGCSTGGLSFRLSKYYSSVKAIDYSGRFIDCCMQLQQQNQIDYVIDNDTQPPITIKLPVDAEPDRIRFYQLTWLPVEIGSEHDAVIVCNQFLNRVSKPTTWLLRLREIVVPGGVVVIDCSPDSLIDTTLDLEYFHSILDEHFSLVHNEELSTMRRLSDSEFKFSNSLFSVWKRH